MLEACRRRLHRSAEDSNRPGAEIVDLESQHQKLCPVLGEGCYTGRVEIEYQRQQQRLNSRR